MWNELPKNEKETYKRLILAYTSFSRLNSQKADNDENISPVISSKFQETVFAYSFNATEEDIGNTSFDASLKIKNDDGSTTKCLVGIKTFGINSGAQKIAQFKANTKEWNPIFSEIETASSGIKDKDTIDKINHERYLNLAHKIARIRNERIDSSIARLKGFKITDNDNIESVYHTLMPSKSGDAPKIFVGETDYAKIDEDNLTIEGCTTNKHPQNFAFSDGHHSYRYTSADSQLLMNFDNEHIVQDTWNVKYVNDPVDLFLNIYDQTYGSISKNKSVAKPIAAIPKITESYSWKITNKNGEVEKFSGWNGFFGIGSKLSKNGRMQRISNLRHKYTGVIPENSLSEICNEIQDFLLIPSPSEYDKNKKVLFREKIMKQVESLKNNTFKEDVSKLLFRPSSEMYIPIHNSKKFHSDHPDFFGKGNGEFDTDGKKMKHPKNSFKLVFEPSGDSIDAFITQDNGKAIESSKKQSILGDWILQNVFQLKKYEPLTSKRLNEIGINGFRLYRIDSDDAVHLEFIWLDDSNLPEDFQKE